MSKKLVVYFSASGVTKKAAETVAETVSAELYEIKPQVLYTKADLDWRDKNSRSTLEMADKASRPSIVEDDAHIADYDTIYLGFPIWWYIAPTIVNTFLEKYDFSGKKIVLFATSGSSGWGETLQFLQNSAPGAEWEVGKVFSGPFKTAAAADWAKKTV